MDVLIHVEGPTTSLTLDEINLADFRTEKMVGRTAVLKYEGQGFSMVIGSEKYAFINAPFAGEAVLADPKLGLEITNMDSMILWFQHTKFPQKMIKLAWSPRIGEGSWVNMTPDIVHPGKVTSLY